MTTGETSTPYLPCHNKPHAAHAQAYKGICGNLRKHTTSASSRLSASPTQRGGCRTMSLTRDPANVEGGWGRTRNSSWQQRRVGNRRAEILAAAIFATLLQAQNSQDRPKSKTPKHLLVSALCFTGWCVLRNTLPEPLVRAAEVRAQMGARVMSKVPRSWAA